MAESRPDVNFEAWFRRGFDSYKDNIFVLAVASVLSCIVGAATLGLLAAPMAAGMALMALHITDPQKDAEIKLEDIFRGFDYMLDSWLFFAVWGITALAIAGLLISSCFGWLLLLPALLSIFTLLMFGLFLVVDRKMEFWSASKASMEMVKKNFFPFACFMLLAALAGISGLMACVVGVIFTMPLAFCVLAAAYRDVFGNSRSN